MKKDTPIIASIIIGILLFIFCYDFNDRNYPNEYYNVYLNGEFLGTILSKTELENYINEKTSHLINIKEVTKTYCGEDFDEVLNDEEVRNLLDKSVNSSVYDIGIERCIDITIEDGQTIENIYTPNGLEVEKTIAYNKDVTSIEDIYSEIVSKESFTIKGYQFTLNNSENDKVTQLYTTDKDIFEVAVTSFIETYLGKDEYNSYMLGTQKEIETTGSLIENVYIGEDITVKEKQIPIDEVIYTTSSDLAQFLLFGNNPVSSKYIVEDGEMISDVAYKNEISSQEFLISNPRYKDENSLIKAGTEVSIKQTNPQLKVIIEMYSVEDKSSEYKTVYQYDKNLYVGQEKVSQKGEKGLERISQKLKIENGVTVYVEPKGKEVLKPSVDRIIVRGEKAVPIVGVLGDWGWPSESGWTSTSGYEWRIHPISGIRSFHYGIDIAGTGYNSNVYASNNGVIYKKVAYHYSFGNYIVIDHNNGYYTLYAHMNKFASGLNVGDAVAKGQVIGYVGSTGESTGPHIHFEVWKGCDFCRINPWSLFR